MTVFGIDLSMRSTGISVIKDKQLIAFKVVKNNILKDESLFIHNVNEITEFIYTYISADSVFAIEGLSLNSLSGEKDKIYGQFWYLRCVLKLVFPDTPIRIIPVKEWRSPLFTKAENKILSEAKKTLKTDKVSIKGMKGDDRKITRKINQELKDAANIKLLTFNKLPETIKNEFNQYIAESNLPDESKYDLADSFFIASHIN